MATVARGRKMYRGVMQAVFNGNGGLRGAGAWRLHGKFWEFLGIFERGMGAPLYTPWVCLPQSGVARVIDVPQGGAGCMAAVARGRRGCGACEWT